jgi:hypothetical protein
MVSLLESYTTGTYFHDIFFKRNKSIAQNLINMDVKGESSAIAALSVGHSAPGNDNEEINRKMQCHTILFD